MSDAGADRVDARLSGLEATVDQMDARMGDVHDRIENVHDRLDRLDERMTDRFNSLEKQIARNRTEMRREMLVIAAVVTAILGGLQLLVAWGIV